MELLISTIRHFYSNEKLIETKVAEFFKLESSNEKQVAGSSKSSKNTGSGSGGGAGSSGGTGDGATGNVSAGDTSTSQATPPSADPTPSQHPGVDPSAMQQLVDMGFSQDVAAEALVACGNSFPLAMDWILTHSHQATVSSWYLFQC